jgi:hypothetical protein
MDKKSLIPILLFICLPLFACSSGATPDSPMEPELVEVSQPEPTEEIAPTEEASTVRITSVHQIEGTWIALADIGNYVMNISPEGIFTVATSVEALEQGSTDSWTLTFEGQNITASGFAMCLGEDGTYAAVMNEDGSIKFTSILDPCEPRLRKMDHSLPGHMHPYNLIYYRVDTTE